MSDRGRGFVTVAESPHAGGVALLSPSGWGNLGDAAIVDSAVHAVRTRLPNAPILGLTLNPADTAWRHRIPAFTCTGFALDNYGVTENVPSAFPSSVLGEAPDGMGAEGTSSDGLEAVRRALRAVPGLRATWKTARIVRADIRHRRLLSHPSSRLKRIVVAGGGQLDDFWGGPFGHPYVLWRWARRARGTGSHFIFLSVGTGTLDTPLSKYFVHQALAAASYRSFRDEGSRGLVGDRRVSDDPVVPDLAYGLPIPGDAGRRPGLEPSVIGVSPMAHCDPRVWPIQDAGRYRSYLERLAIVAARLLDEGHALVLYGTDRPDQACVTDLRAEIARRVTPESLERVRSPRVGTLAELFGALAGVHLTLASRLHGVILPHLLGVPVVALSYERKVGVIMRTMGCEKQCLDIDEFQPEQVLESVRGLLPRRDDVSRDILALVARFRRQVEAQYDLVFGETQ